MTAIAELTVNLQGPWGLPLYFPKNLLQNHFQHFPEPSGKIRAYSDRRMPTGRLMTAFSSDLRQAFPEFSEFYPSDLNPPGIRRSSSRSRNSNPPNTFRQPEDFLYKRLGRAQAEAVSSDKPKRNALNGYSRCRSALFRALH